MGEPVSAGEILPHSLALQVGTVPGTGFNPTYNCLAELGKGKGLGAGTVSQIPDPPDHVTLS